jgi:hypothetical protein
MYKIQYMKNFTFIISLTLSYFASIVNKHFDNKILFYLYSKQMCYGFSNELVMTIFTNYQIISKNLHKNLVFLNSPIN